MKLLVPALAFLALTVMAAQGNAAAFSSQEAEIISLADVLFR